MNGYFLLIAAIVLEVFGSTMLKVANGFKKLFPIIGVILGYGLAFYILSLSLKHVPLGMAYAIWSGVGTALTALIGVIVFKEGMTRKKLLGLGFIIGGVVLINIQ